jgi:fatty acid kinase fatty acid binding subunit
MVAVVTDGAADVPPALAEELGIEVVPLEVRFGAEPHTGDGFYVRLRNGEVPSTSAPSVGDWLAGFERAGSDEIVCVTLAAALSATNHEAVLAAERFDGRVTVVDSGTASMAEGFVALEAARRARDGAGAQEVAVRAREIAGRVRLLGAIETFEYLRRSGRVTRLQAYAATAMSIRPVFRLGDGVIEPVARARTRSRSLDVLAGDVDTSGGPLHVAVLHADAEGDARALLERVRARSGGKLAEELVVGVTPVIGANAGPGLVGLAHWSEPS